MRIDDLGRFPVNTRGYHVIPVISLTGENMNDSLVGLKVTIGLGDPDKTVTQQGTIVGYDENKIHVTVGVKTKKFSYDPVNIQLQVYQFEKRILFSNERPSQKDIDSAQESVYNEEVGSEEVSNEPAKPTNKRTKDVEKEETSTKNTRKKASPKPKKEQAKAEESYQPVHGIQWS